MKKFAARFRSRNASGTLVDEVIYGEAPSKTAFQKRARAFAQHNSLRLVEVWEVTE